MSNFEVFHFNIQYSAFDIKSLNLMTSDFRPETFDLRHNRPNLNITTEQ
jgi:hypothetical protein